VGSIKFSGQKIPRVVVPIASTVSSSGAKKLVAANPTIIADHPFPGGKVTRPDPNVATDFGAE
jgi:hypothetical protein